MACCRTGTDRSVAQGPLVRPGLTFERQCHALRVSPKGCLRPGRCPGAGRFVNGELINCRMVMPGEGKRMLAMSKIVLPYEPDYVGHREAEKRRQETKEWLRRREREFAERSPSIVPERTPEPDKKR